MQAWWSATLRDFRLADPVAILGVLSTRLVETHVTNRETQIIACFSSIPRCASDDGTRDPATFDLIADFLLDCGTAPLAKYNDKEPILPGEGGLLS